MWATSGGLTRQLEHLAGLGVTCLWLMPFYPTPNHDDGYDVADYYGVDPRFGSLGDLVEMIRTANERGIRVIADLVVNHTSVEHPWFRDARSSKDSPFRSWYVWSDEERDEPKMIIFPDQEDSNWAWDEEAGQYYLHRFYSSEPDLNVANPEVRDEINRIVGFWLELGLSGFRVDAVPYLIGDVGIEEEMPDEPHRVLREIRSFLSRRRGDGVLFGEVNLDPGDRTAFFGDMGGEMTGLFNFILSGAMFVALARGEAEPLARHLRETPSPPDVCQWLNFIRNHDELNLSRLPDDERVEVMDAFAPDEDMRIYDRGIRRRMASMVGGDPRKERLLLSLVLSLPGTPVLYYGEEIGMGELLSLEGRSSVRTPMQWSRGANGGFSTAEPDQLVRPVVTEGPHAVDHVNVADQRREPDSLLNWTERAIRARKHCPELGFGAWSVLDTGHPAVLGHLCHWLDRCVVVVHNLSDAPAAVRLDLDSDDLEALSEELSDRAYDEIDPTDVAFELEPHGYRWLKLRYAGARKPLT